MLGALWVALVPLRAAGSTFANPPSFDELVDRARTIFVGEAIDTRAIWESTPQGRSIVTQVTFKVDDVWKGSVGAVTRLEFLGGTIGDVTLDVSGVPSFRVGQRDVLFVSGDSLTVSPLVGFMYGRLRVERDAVSGVDRVRAFDGRWLSSTAEIGRPRVSALLPSQPMRLSDVAAAVRARVRAGRQP
jgi:hypothetical protein